MEPLISYLKGNGKSKVPIQFAPGSLSLNYSFTGESLAKSKMRTLILGTFLFLVILGESSIDASKILAVFPSTSKTNYIFGQVLFEQLASRGHEVSALRRASHV